MIDRPLRMLVVDNEVNRCDGIVEYLHSSFPSWVDKATSVEQTWEVVLHSKSPYHLALIDDTLPPCIGQKPELVGMDLTTRIKAKYPSTEIIVFTGQSMANTEQSLRPSAFRCLTKPFRLNDLDTVVRETVERQGWTDVDRRTQTMERLLKISSELLASQSETEILDVGITAIQEAGFERVRIYLLSDDGKYLACKAQSGMGAEFTAMQYPVEADACIQSFFNSCRTFIKRGGDMSCGFEKLPGEDNLEERAYIPLLVHSKIIGIAVADNKLSHSPINEKELESVALFASQVTIALQRARLTTNKRTQVRNIDIIFEFCNAIYSSFNLDQVSNAASRVALKLSDADHSILVLLDQNNLSGTVQGEFPRLGVSGLSLTVDDNLRNCFINNGEPIVFSDIKTDFPIEPLRGILVDLKVNSAIFVPIASKDKVLGFLSLHKIDSPGILTREEVELYKSFAHQVAFAIENTLRYQNVVKENTCLLTLHRTAKAIIANMGLNRKQMLDSISHIAFESFTTRGGSNADFSAIYLLDEVSGDLHLEGKCSSQVAFDSAAKLAEESGFEFNTQDRAGLARRAVLFKAPQIVDDLFKDYNYSGFDLQIRSEMVVPLLDKDTVLGALSIGSLEIGAFDKHDLRTLERLAELIVLIVQNEKRENLIGARTALAWMGMTSSTWRHAIHGHAITIQDLVEQAKWDLKKYSPISVKDKLSEIHNLASLIGELPMIAPLTSEEYARSVLINSFLQERLKQLWEHETYKSICLNMEFELESSATVKANSDWLNRAIDVLIDNAVQAMKDSEKKILTVRTHRHGVYAVIDIMDTGKGIPHELMPKLLSEPITHPKGYKNLGIGLLMARLILQVYGGDIVFTSTGAHGTTLTIRLPLES
jgi:GAF domain-containing protein